MKFHFYKSIIVLVKFLRKQMFLMVYKCKNQGCGFLFSREGEVLQCPVCGKTNIRPATAEEEKEFYELLKKDQQRH